MGFQADSARVLESGRKRKFLSLNAERYVPSIDPYNAAMHLGHTASYKHALRYAYGRRVLDVGCGVGYGAHYLASFGAGWVAAMDIDGEALNDARLEYAHPRVHYQRGSADRLPYADAAFEFVLSSQVIEHVADPRLFLAEIKRVLQPGGFCMIFTPNKDLFSPDSASSLNEFHPNEMNLARFEALGRAVFPRVEMAGVAQNCLARQPDNSIRLKANELLRPEDYRMRRDDLARCENLVLFGHTQARGEFLATLPDSLSRASTEPSPCFWDPSTGKWIELGLYPAAGPEGRAGRPSAAHVFRSPSDALFRIDVALRRAGAGPMEITLRDGSPHGHVLARAAAQPSDDKLSLTFEPISDSAGREFCLELRPRRGLLDILLRRKGGQPQLEYRGGRLAFWTFHQTLPG